MFSDYATVVFTSTCKKSIEKFNKLNKVFLLPEHISSHKLIDPLEHDKIISHYTEAFTNYDKDDLIYFSSERNKEEQYIVYTILRNDVVVALYDFIQERIEYIKVHDRETRLKMGESIRLFFSSLFADADFTDTFVNDLQICNFCRDFRLGHYIHETKLIQPSASYYLEVNIRFSTEHTQFLKKVLNIKDTYELLYRGYIVFSKDLLVDNFKLSLFSQHDLYREHLVLEGSKSFTLSSREKPRPYIYNPNLKSFLRSCNPCDYKQYLYHLLKFHNPKDINNKYATILPELYAPSAYDFSQISYDEWDMRLLIDEMVTI